VNIIEALHLAKKGKTLYSKKCKLWLRDGRENPEWGAKENIYDRLFLPATLDSDMEHIKNEIETYAIHSARYTADLNKYNKNVRLGVLEW